MLVGQGRRRVCVLSRSRVLLHVGEGERCGLTGAGVCMLSYGLRCWRGGHSWSRLEILCFQES